VSFVLKRKNFGRIFQIRANIKRDEASELETARRMFKRSGLNSATHSTGNVNPTP